MFYSQPGENNLSHWPVRFLYPFTGQCAPKSITNISTPPSLEALIMWTQLIHTWCSYLRTNDIAPQGQEREGVCMCVTHTHTSKIRISFVPLTWCPIFLQSAFLFLLRCMHILQSKQTCVSEGRYFIFCGSNVTCRNFKKNTRQHLKNMLLFPT